MFRNSQICTCTVRPDKAVGNQFLAEVIPSPQKPLAPENSTINLRK